MLLVTALFPFAIHASAFGVYHLLLLAILGVLAIATFDLAKSRDTLSPLKIRLDPVSRMSRGSEGDFRVYFNVDGSALKTFRMALAFDESLVCDENLKDIQAPESDTGLYSTSFQVHPLVRGVFKSPDVYVEAASTFGFFKIRRAFATKDEIRVYPNLHRERKQLANLFMNRGVTGTHLQRQTGQGREYEQLREYAPGDSILDIHWKASAKRGGLATKMYQVERTQHVYFILDHSRLSALRVGKDGSLGEDLSVEESFLERYVTVASVLGMAAEKQGDLFGMVAYGSRVSRFVRANAGRQHSQVVQDALFNLTPEMAPADVASLFTFLRLRIRQRALLIFMTDLADGVAAEEFKKHVGLISRNHYVIVNSIRRPGVYPAFSDEYDAPSIAQQISGHLRWEGLRRLKSDLDAMGVQFSLLDQEKLSVDVVNQYLSVKQRQLI